MLAAMLLQKPPESAENKEKILKDSVLNGEKSTYCRTCLGNGNLRQLFGSYKPQNDEMTYKLHLVTGLKIEENDELSQKMCSKCFGAVDFSLRFRFQSQQSHETLQQMLKQHNKDEQITEPKKTYPLHIKTSKNEGKETYNLKTNDKLTYPFEVKLECYKKEDEPLDEPIDNDIDSEDDLKPLTALKKEMEPHTVLEPIVTIKKIAKETNNSANTNTKKRKTQKETLDKRKRKRQDRLNKIRTYIKVDNLPADWYGFIKPVIKKKNLSKKPNKQEKEQGKDSVKGEEAPVFIKVENLPEDMDKVPMPKIPRPERRKKIPDGPPYKCSTCDKEYMKRPIYLAHIRFHTHFHVCEQCGKRCKNPSLLRTHQRAVHGAAKIHACSLCEYTASTRCALIVHERRHKDERPFVCDHCGAAFYTRRTLTQHVGVHMPANIQCPHCPKKCKSMKLLSNHRARKHARRYIYHCPVCPKQFNDNNAVHKHLAGYHGMPREHHPTIDKQLVA